VKRLRVMFAIGAMYGGGSERQIVHLLRHLDRKRFEPQLYLVDRTGPLLDQIPEDVRIHAFSERAGKASIYFPGRNYSRRISDYARCLVQTSSDISYDRTFLMTLTAAAGAARAGLPAVSTIVTDPERGFAPVAGRFQSMKRRRLSALYNRTAQTLAVSEGAKQAAIRFYGIREEQILTHRNGVDTAAIEQQQHQAVNDDWWNAPLKPGKNRLLRIAAAGRLHHDKGFHLLIEAASRIQRQDEQLDLRLAVLGEGDHRSTLQKQIDDAGMSDRLRLPGFQVNPIAWYHSADVFVLPSLVEGMPNVLLEAMACGTPVIAADCQSGPREILAGGQLGQLIPAGSAAALKTALQQADEERVAAVATAHTARSVIHKEWSVRRSVAELEDILQRAAANHGRTGKTSESWR